VPSRDDTQADRNRLRAFDFAGQVRLGNVEMKPATHAMPFSTGDRRDLEQGDHRQPQRHLHPAAAAFPDPYIALIETKLALNPTEDVEMKQRALAK
jgi:hypothetical protein